MEKLREIVKEREKERKKDRERERDRGTLLDRKRECKSERGGTWSCTIKLFTTVIICFGY